MRTLNPFLRSKRLQRAVNKITGGVADPEMMMADVSQLPTAAHLADDADAAVGMQQGSDLEEEEEEPEAAFVAVADGQGTGRGRGRGRGRGAGRGGTAGGAAGGRGSGKGRGGGRKRASGASAVAGEGTEATASPGGETPAASPATPGDSVQRSQASRAGKRAKTGAK